MHKQVKQCIEEFDWGRVYKVMELLDWQWVDNNLEHGVPTIGKMVIQAAELLHEVLHNKDRYREVECGGFCASIDKDDTLELKFVVSSSYGEKDAK